MKRFFENSSNLLLSAKRLKNSLQTGVVISHFVLLNEEASLMMLACHKKSYLICVEFLKYYAIFIYFQAAVSALLAVSVC